MLFFKIVVQTDKGRVFIFEIFDFFADKTEIPSPFLQLTFNKISKFNWFHEIKNLVASIFLLIYFSSVQKYSNNSLTNSSSSIRDKTKKFIFVSSSYPQMYSIKIESKYKIYKFYAFRG